MIGMHVDRSRHGEGFTFATAHLRALRLDHDLEIEGLDFQNSSFAFRSKPHVQCLKYAKKVGIAALLVAYYGQNLTEMREKGEKK